MASGLDELYNDSIDTSGTSQCPDISYASPYSLSFAGAFYEFSKLTTNSEAVKFHGKRKSKGFNSRQVSISEGILIGETFENRWKYPVEFVPTPTVTNSSFSDYPNLQIVMTKDGCFKVELSSDEYFKVNPLTSAMLTTRNLSMLKRRPLVN